MRFSSEVKTVGAAKVRRTRFVVQMFPASELVFISGTEYFNAGTRFRIFAEKYREGLRREKLVDDGVIGTLFSTDDRSRETHVPAMAGGWLKVGHWSFGPTAGVKPGTAHAPVVGADVSIVDMYKYLSSVGASEPGRVKEVGIFSHSWPGGPILFNTSDSSGAARLATDFDGRRKDFNATNAAGWPKLKAAMAPGGSWHVWGCSATTHHKNLTVAAHKHKKAGDHAFFTVATTVTHHDGTTAQSVEERTTRSRVRFNMDQRFRSFAYMAAAASHLGIAVYGAPPGVGSSFDQKRSVMFIDTAAYASLFAYFKDEFGPQFAPTDTTYDRGYVDYQKLATRPAATAAAFSSEAYNLSKDFTPPGESTLTVETGHQLSLVGTGATLKVTARTGFATAGKTGHQYELRDAKDPGKSRAIYVQEDRQVFRVELDAGGKFTVLGAKL